MRASLMIVFNQPFVENIPKLEQLYRGRFPDLDYLVPFVPDSPHIFAVHCRSDIFQGYFAEVYPRIRNNPFNHFIFCADDLLLNPSLNAGNILGILNLKPGVGYIKEAIPLAHGFHNGWMHTMPAFAAISKAQYNGILPRPETAAQLIGRHGIPWVPINKEHLAKYQQTTTQPDGYTAELTGLVARFGDYYAYPLVYGYSDFIVVPAEAFNLFAHYCGLFASINLFVEVAVPTALLMSCNAVNTEAHINWEGTEYWDAQRIEKLQRFNYNLPSLLQSFESNQLYIHPVKLSQWRL